MSVKVIKAKCPSEHPCPSVKICPTGALKQNNSDAPVVNRTKCTECGLCVEVCPKGALVIPG